MRGATCSHDVGTSASAGGTLPGVSESNVSRNGTEVLSPMTALLPGAFLTFVGTWMLTDGGPVALGWASAVLRH